MNSLIHIDTHKQKNTSISQLPLAKPPNSYRSKDVFPDWLLANDDWKILKGRKLANEVSDIFKIPIEERTQEQCMVLIEWMMFVWPTSAQMGCKRVSNMMKEFKYNVFHPGECIVREGDRGLSFFIIISGHVEVLKNEVGVVGHLTKGATFGEIALMNQSSSGEHESDLRTATIKVIGTQPVEALSLHKVDYDHFVRDIQLIEKRENFIILKESRLLQSWPRSKLEKLSNTALRRIYQENDEIVFRQGDSSNHIFFVVEGSVKIMKEVAVTATNRWPVGSNQWHEEHKKASMPIVLNILEKGDYFGEVAVLRNCKRTASAIINSPKTVLILVDRLEFLHTFMLVSRHQSVSNIEDEVKKYKADHEVLREIAKIKGGPSSYVSVGNATYYPNHIGFDDNNIMNDDKNNPYIAEKSNELKSDIDHAHISVQSYSSDLRKTLRTLFPTIIHDDDSIVSKHAHTKRRLKKRNVHNKNHAAAKLAYHEEKTKTSINEILVQVIKHEAVHNHNTFMMYQQLSPRVMEEDDDGDSPKKAAMINKDATIQLPPPSLLSPLNRIKSAQKQNRPSSSSSSSSSSCVSPRFSRPTTGLCFTEKPSELGSEFPDLHISFNPTQKPPPPSSSSSSFAMASPKASQSLKFSPSKLTKIGIKPIKTLLSPSSHPMNMLSPLLAMKKPKSPQELTLDLIFSTSFLASPKSLLNKAKLTYKDVTDQ